MSPSGRSTPRAGWVLLLGILFVSAIIGWRMLSFLGSRGARAVGDGKNVASYGFDLDPCLVPREMIVAGGIPKDGVKVLDLPALLSREQVDALAESRRRKLLVSHDRVIGVEIDGRARAYPLRLMNWHEVVNDTLCGTPIAVTYNPLCDAIVVFDRRVVGEELRFGVSGLLFNSNMLMYDRREGGGDGKDEGEGGDEGEGEESLWSQLLARAVTGPAAARGETLAILPAALMHWEAWRALHPGTSVLAPDPALLEEYRRDPYGSYSSSDILRFPVDPKPPAGGPGVKELVLIVGVEKPCVFPFSWLAARTGLGSSDTGFVMTPRSVAAACEGVPLEIVVDRDPLVVWVQPAAGAGERTRPPVRYAYWFAWHATNPGVPAL